MPNDVSLNLRINTDDFVARITQAASSTETMSKRSSKALENIAKQMAINNRLAREAAGEASGGAASKGIAEGFSQGSATARKFADDAAHAAKNMEHVGFATVGAKRELLVLAHEVSQGRWTNFAGSLMVLGERTNAMELIASKTGLAIGALAGLFGFMGFQVIKGTVQATEFNNQLLLTANYAGMTAGKMGQMAEAIAKSTRSSVGTGRDALSALQGTGAVGPENMAAAGEAVVRYTKLTGDEADKVAAHFGRMRDGVAKWAEEQNKSMHFMTTGLYQTVVALEKAGKTGEAMNLVLEAMNTQLRAADKPLGTFASLWQAVKNSVYEAVDGLNSIGRGTNVDEQLKKVGEQLAFVNKERARGRTDQQIQRDWGISPQQIASWEALNKTLGASKQLSQSVADAQARHARETEKGIAASDWIKTKYEQIHAASTLKRELEELAKKEKEVVASGGKVDPTQHAAMVADIMKKNRDHGAQQGETLHRNFMKQMNEEIAKLEEQITQYQRLGKAENNANEAQVLRRQAPGGDLAGRSESEKAAERSAAIIADFTEGQKKYEERIAAIRKSVAAYEQLAAARKVSAREAYIEEQLNSHNLTQTQLMSREMSDYAAKVRKLAGERYDAQRNESFTADATKRDLAFKRELDAINRQNDALTQTTLEREHAADAARLQASAEQELSKYPEREAEIQAKLRDEIEATTAARNRQYANSRKGGVGATQGMNKFFEDATNEAANAEKMVSGMFDRMSLAVEKFATTGKLNFGDLWSFMASEYLRQMSRMVVAQFMPGGGGVDGLLKMFSMASSGGSFGTATGSPTLDAGIAAISGFAADGAGVRAGSSTLVGEHGPEVFKATGSGDIIPLSELSGAGGATHFDFSGQTINVGQGVSRAEVAAAVRQSNAAAVGQIKRLVATGRLV
jgi:lambda family phage tail tape measure protein